MTESLLLEEKVLLKFIQMRDEIKAQFTAEMGRIAEATQRQEEATTKFIAYSEDFAKLAGKIDNQIEESIQQGATLIADRTGQQLIELVKQEITAIVDNETAELQTQLKTLLNDLNIGVQQAVTALNNKKQALTKTGYLVAGAFCLSSLLVAWGIHYWFPRHTTYKLSDNMAQAYFVGERILNNWSKFDNKEKDKILELTINE